MVRSHAILAATPSEEPLAVLQSVPVSIQDARNFFVAAVPLMSKDRRAGLVRDLTSPQPMRLVVLSITAESDVRF